MITCDDPPQSIKQQPLISLDGDYFDASFIETNPALCVWRPLVTKHQHDQSCGRRTVQ